MFSKQNIQCFTREKKHKLAIKSQCGWLIKSDLNISSGFKWPITGYWLLSIIHFFATMPSFVLWFKYLQSPNLLVQFSCAKGEPLAINIYLEGKKLWQGFHRTQRNLVKAQVNLQKPSITLPTASVWISCHILLLAAPQHPSDLQIWWRLSWAGTGSCRSPFHSQNRLQWGPNIYLDFWNVHVTKFHWVLR